MLRADEVKRRKRLVGAPGLQFTSPAGRLAIQGGILSAGLPECEAGTSCSQGTFPNLGPPRTPPDSRKFEGLDSSGVVPRGDLELVLELV